MPLAGAGREAVDAGDCGLLIGVFGEWGECRRSRRCGARSARGSPARPSASAISTSRPILYISRCRRAASSPSASVSIQIAASASPATYPCIARKSRSGKAQDAHVGLHVALAVQQGGIAAVAAVPRASMSLVSCPCRYSAASGPVKRSLPRVGAVEQAALLAQLPVLGVQLDCRRIGHGSDSRKIASRPGHSVF